MSEQYEQILHGMFAKYEHIRKCYFYKVIEENEYVVVIISYNSISFSFFEGSILWTTECDDYYICDWSSGDISHSNHVLEKESKTGITVPVLDAIGQIKDQNLEYETSCSGIKG